MSSASDAPRALARVTVGPRPDFAATLRDGRRVVGRHGDGEWSVYVYAPGGRMLGYGTARGRLRAFELAGLSGEDGGELLGRAGV